MDSEIVHLIYDLAIVARVTWQAHSLSNAGNNGSNRILPRRQLLANGVLTDACHGNITKHEHAGLLAEYFQAWDVPLCPACAQRDGRRVAALIDTPEYRGVTIERILRECGLCDSHGFLVPAKNPNSDGSSAGRQKINKDTILNFSFALALPDHYAESEHLITRMGNSKEEGQMLMKVPARSGVYAACVQYMGVRVGVDTKHWQVVVEDDERRRRHQAILSCLRDALLSPQGAMTGTMLPHLTGLSGAVVIRPTVGRAPLYSVMAEDFEEQLQGLAKGTSQIIPFATVSQFQEVMDHLIKTTEPAKPGKDNTQKLAGVRSVTGSGMMPEELEE
ncbi:MAG TPA: hypothetical protein VKT82_04200 [Ktedonobacterales bacterium]|nr:hypothetical protein [Ktedonobacterales bacterium]